MPLVTRGDGVSIPQTNRALISTTVDVWDEMGANIGFIQSLQLTDTRRADRIRHLDKEDAGRIIEQAPAPDDPTLNITGFALYSQGGRRQSLVHRITGGRVNFRSLNGQHIPFDITERSVHPADANSAQMVYYLANWLTNWTRPINIGTITVSETAITQPCWVE